MAFPFAALGAGAAIGGLGLSAYSMFGMGRDTPDISGELENIRKLYAQQRAYAEQASKEMLGQANKLSSNRLALMGVYDSPVSEYTYGQNAKDAQTALMQSLAGIAGQEAQTRSSIMNSLMGYKSQEAQRSQQAMGQLAAALGGVGSSFMTYGAQNQPAQGRMPTDRFQPNIPGNTPMFRPQPQWIY